MSKYLMGIDNGGTSSKAAIYDTSGHEIAKATYYTKMLTPHRYWTERDMEDLRQINIKAIQRAILLADIDPKDIVGISITGHGNGLYLIGENGSYVRNGIISTDNRAHEIVENWLANPEYDSYIRPIIYSTIWAAQQPALLKWLDENEPDVYEKTKYVFMVDDLVRYWLTGQASFDRSNAAGSCLLDLETGEYADKVFGWFGISKWLSKMPPLINSADNGGTVTAEAARETGLRPGIPVAGGMMDIAASGLSLGLTEHNHLAVVTGTWGIHEYLDNKISSTSGIQMTMPYAVPGEYLLSTNSPTSASNLEWFIDNFMHDRRGLLDLVDNGESIYDYCAKLVESVKPEDSKVLFYPYIFGSNASVENASSGFIGATKDTTLAEFLRAIYEGVCFAHMTHIEQLLRVNPRLLKENPVRMAGGATNSKVWVQMFADMFQQDVELVDVKENGTLGCAIEAGVMAGIFPDFKTACEQMVHVKSVIHPNKERGAVYAKKYELFKKAITDQARVWADVEQASFK
ncbi:MAG: carbohydrate kinase [Lactobacillus sp.]|jgi:L-xylulokinase|nr:carbohydrate kinase [Lactobacillus sp.]MCI1481074.1 carbohydrate kinase [Lactobacillus sp.]